MEVNIYISVYHSGHLSKGTGIYGILLEYIDPDGNRHTKEIYEGIMRTTRHRTALRACITALSRMKKKCFINLYINDTYVAETMIQGWFYRWNFESWTNQGKPVKNADLWQQLFQYLENQKVKFEYSINNPYTDQVENKLKVAEIRYIEDRKGSL